MCVIRDVTTIFKLLNHFSIYYRNPTLQVGLELENTSTGVPRVNDCATSTGVGEGIARWNMTLLRMKIIFKKIIQKRVIFLGT